ncbi:hypothetical protein DFH09DRAFT_1312430 [Mycena vulgaris]|nr:hypothetical protein DFH09DRAFT_1312430 [Mycena vulgaris]
MNPRGTWGLAHSFLRHSPLPRNFMGQLPRCRRLCQILLESPHLIALIRHLAVTLDLDPLIEPAQVRFTHLVELTLGPGFGYGMLSGYFPTQIISLAAGVIPLPSISAIRISSMSFETQLDLVALFRHRSSALASLSPQGLNFARETLDETSACTPWTSTTALELRMNTRTDVDSIAFTNVIRETVDRFSIHIFDWIPSPAGNRIEDLHLNIYVKNYSVDFKLDEDALRSHDRQPPRPCPAERGDIPHVRCCGS